MSRSSWRYNERRWENIDLSVRDDILKIQDLNWGDIEYEVECFVEIESRPLKIETGCSQKIINKVVDVLKRTEIKFNTNKEEITIYG